MNPCECGHSIGDHGGEPEWQLSSHCIECGCVGYDEDDGLDCDDESFDPVLSESSGG